MSASLNSIVADLTAIYQLKELLPAV